MFPHLNRDLTPPIAGVVCGGIDRLSRKNRMRENRFVQTRIIM